MKKVTHKIVAIFMVAVLMASTTSLSFYKHFCGDNLVEISFEKVDSCCEFETEAKELSNLNFSEKDCCKNETEIKNILTFDNTKSLKIVKNQIVFFTSFYYTFIDPIEVIHKKTNFYTNFSPPEIVYNKQIQFQSFLI